MTESKYIFKNNTMGIGQIGNTEIVENRYTKKIFYRKTISSNEIPGKYEAGKKTIDIIKNIKHENLVEITDVEEDEAKGEIYIYVEPYELNLKQLIEKDKQFFQNQENLGDFIRQIIAGYCQLMEFQIIHRDLKPENILCIKKNDKYTFKISDYGFSKVISQSAQHDMTIVERQAYYQAPERTEDEYSFRCDVYSFGLILAEIVLNRKLTEEEKQKLLVSVNRLKQIVCEEIVNLIKSMLKEESSQRISWTELKLYYFYPKDKEGLRAENIITHEKVWIKSINKKEHGDISSENNEIIINLRFKKNEEKNNHIVKVLEVLNESSYQYAYLILEKCDGDLKQLINEHGNFTFEEILDFLEQLCDGYKFLIKQEIVHRDLKPENILYCKTDKGIRYKITDFQHSFDVKMRKKSANTKTGTAKYQAPEIDEKQDYDYKCDIFSLGITILALFKDFSLEQINRMKKRLKERECIIKILEDISFGFDISKIDQKLKDLLKRMIRYNPQDRLSWEELIQYIQNQKQQKQPIQKNSEYGISNEQIANKFNNNVQSIQQVQQNINNNQYVQDYQEKQQQKNEQQFNVQESTSQNNQTQIQSNRTNYNSQTIKNSINSQMQNEFQQTRQIPGQSSSNQIFTFKKHPLQQSMIQGQQSADQKQFGQNQRFQNFPQQSNKQTSQNQQAQIWKDEPRPNITFPFQFTNFPNEQFPKSTIQGQQPTQTNQQPQNHAQRQFPFTNPQSIQPNKAINQLPPNLAMIGQQSTSQNQYAQNKYNGQQIALHQFRTPQPQQQQQIQFKFPTQNNQQFQPNSMIFNHFSNLNLGQLNGNNGVQLPPKSTNSQNQ